MSVNTETWPDGVDVDKVRDAVTFVAARVYQRYRKLKTVEEPDLQQELWLWAWRKREKVREFLDREDRKQARKGWSALLTSLERAGERWCQKAKADEIGYSISDVVWYTAEGLQDWISVLTNGVGVLTNQSDEAANRGGALPNERFNTEATLADVEAALGILDPLDRYMLVEHYGHGTTLRKVSEVVDLSESTVQRRMKNSLKAMVDYLGGPRPW